MNNFDISSTGENIEFNCFYDTSLAQSFYDDFERENTRINFGRDNSLFLLGDASAPYYKKSDLMALSKQALYDLCFDYGLHSAETNDLNKIDFIEDLMAVTIERHYQFLISECNWFDIREKITHNYYISKGYNQGDAVYIVSIDRPIDNGLRRYIDNVLWSCPISMYATINELDLYTDDFIGDDIYKYDVDVIAENIARLPISDYAKAWLVKALPTSPSY